MIIDLNVLKSATQQYHLVCGFGVTADDFTSKIYKDIFTAIGVIVDRRNQCDLATIVDELVRQGSRASFADVRDVYESEFSVALIKDYCKALMRENKKSKLLTVSEQLVKIALNETLTIEQAADQAERAITGFTVEASKNVETMNDFLQDSIDDILRRVENKGIQGIETGFTAFDSMLGGLNKGNLVVIAARPAMGKTALALNIAIKASHQGNRCLFMSLEMTKNEVFDRYASIKAGINHTNLRNGNLTDQDLDDLNRLCSNLKKLESPLLVDDTAGQTINEIKSKIRAAHRKQKLDLVVIDYLGLIKDRSARSKNEEMGNITAALKAIAKDINCPVVLLCQLNRDCERRDDKRPLIADLRDSGSIEQDADSVSFIYRDQVYNPNSSRAGITELIVRKNRHGNTGTAFLSDDLSRQRFTNHIGDIPEQEIVQAYTKKSAFS
tara:strand:- start:1177 stop:2499 length:1323 start_codon:yes stop_codon:yes gene_type:complete